jgi:hypothetical protein
MKLESSLKPRVRRIVGKKAEIDAKAALRPKYITPPV